MIVWQWELRRLYDTCVSRVGVEWINVEARLMVLILNSPLSSHSWRNNET